MCKNEEKYLYCEKEHSLKMKKKRSELRRIKKIAAGELHHPADIAGEELRRPSSPMTRSLPRKI